MKIFAILFLFIGIVLVIQAYYTNVSVCPKPKTVIKYVPRSVYEDQLSDKQKLTEFYKVMFNGSKKNTDIYTQANTNSYPNPIELEPNTE